MESNTSIGLGDTIENITKVTGIKKVVDKVSEVLNVPCGCNKRKNTLNAIFPYEQADRLILNDKDK